MKKRALSFSLLLRIVEMIQMVKSKAELLGVIAGGTAGKCSSPRTKSSSRGFLSKGGGAGTVVQTTSGCGEGDKGGEESWAMFDFR